MAFHHRKLNFMNYNGSDYASAFGDNNCADLCAQKNTDKVCVYSNCIDFCPDLCKTPSPPQPKSPGLSLLLTISLSALAAAFFLFTCYTIYRLYSNWRRRRQQPLLQDDGGGPDEFLDQDQGPAAEHHIWYIRTVGLQPSVIGAITIVKYKKGDGLIDGTDCSVCLSEFQEDETLRLLPKCNHAFHVACIDTWLGSHTNCPMCRAGIVAASARLSPPQAAQDSAEEARNGDGGDPAEVRIGIEEDTVPRALTGPKTLRRSVSVDALSKLDAQSVGAKELGVVAKRGGLLRLIGSSSIERTGSSSMKRSLSCSANVFLSRNRGS